MFIFDQVFTIAITGLPVKSLSVSPFCYVRDGGANEEGPLPSQRWLRRLLVSLGVIGRPSVR